MDGDGLDCGDGGKRIRSRSADRGTERKRTRPTSPDRDYQRYFADQSEGNEIK